MQHQNTTTAKLTTFAKLPPLQRYDLSLPCSRLIMFRYAHSGYNVITYGIIDSTLLLCTHIVCRFFTREYLYIG